MSSQTDRNSILEYFRPRGKIVCIGEDLTTELGIINEYLATKNDARLPHLYITTNPAYKTDTCDQVVVFDSETMMPQIYRLLNSYFLIFIFNSSEEGIFKILGAILASIKFSGSIPLFIDTGKGLSQDQKEIFGQNYFNFDCSIKNGRWEFLIFIDSIISGLTPSSGFGVSFSNLIRIFGNSKCLYYGISSSKNLNDAIEESINQIGEKLVTTLPENLEKLQVIFLSIASDKPLSLKILNEISKQIAKTFGKDIEIVFSNVIDSQASSCNIVIILTDSHPIDSIMHNTTSTELLNSVIPKLASCEASNERDITDPMLFNEISDEDERFKILNRIFSDSEIYIFDDGGLPLFASHRPAGQEVCLYTGLFSAIQSMSSDLIGHTPDHLTAGDKRCVFVSQLGPHNSQLRGVAIFNAGLEKSARNDLTASMNLVKRLLEKGEPEYAINDKIQVLLVNGFHNGSIDSILKLADFHAS
ncbi:MAG: hypothetical protein JSW11_03215 [Candidatus Heimdallarchaeota archaeon]|nr:MAG: hypothetical protein JSW11_03215 [Candidatus Heimdallarchaeota archaeon]